MAIDYNAGINSIDVGAHDITYSGNQGPKSPEQERQMAFDDTPRFELQPLEELLEEFRQDNYGEDPKSIDDLRRFFYNKYGPKGIAKVEQAVQQQEQQAQMQQREGIQMADAANPMLQDEYDKYVFEMQEMGQEPMSLEEFRQQAVAGMATGGRAGYKNGSSVQAGAVNYEPSKMVSVPTEFRAREHSPNTHLAYITDDEAGILQALKPDTPHLGPRGIPNYDSYDAQGGYATSGQLDSPTARDISAGVGSGGAGAGGEKTHTGTLSPDAQKAWEEAAPDRKKYREDEQKALKEKEKTWEKGDQYRDPKEEWKETATYKRKRKALLNKLKYHFRTSSKYGKDFDWDSLDDEDLFDLRERLVGMDPKWDDRWSKYGTTTSSHSGTGPWFGKYMAAPEMTQREFDLMYNQMLGNVPTKDETGKYVKPVYDSETGTYTSGFEKWQPSDPREADWLEEMKFNNPMQYANYTGTNYNPTTGEFTKRQDDGYGGVPDAMAAQQQAGIPAAAATQATTSGTIPTGPITVAGGIDPAHQAILKNIYGGTLPTMFAADGGRVGYAGGGIADLRQGYFLGKLVKSVTKPFKGITRGIKKLGKSKLGKAAMMAALYKFGPQILSGEGFGLGDTKKWSGLKFFGDEKNVNLARMLGIPMALGALTADEDDDKSLGYDWEAKKAADDWWIPKFDPSNFRRIEFSADGGRIGYNEGGGYNPGARWSYLINKFNNNEPMTEDEIKEMEMLEITYADETQRMAQGGRIGYQDGYTVDDEEEDNRVAALRAMYGMRRNAQEGGLMDLGGMEKDYRNEGGFVPIGGQERADDVPARLSKNEFVFTAEAVRNAGGGDIDKGAEIMENLMENLEKGGNVSEESQGLEGARDMFATSQRLEGVL